MSQSDVAAAEQTAVTGGGNGAGPGSGNGTGNGAGNGTGTTPPAGPAAPAAAGDADREHYTLTHKQILVILSGLLMGMFLASLDQTIVSTSIRTIADDLKGYDQQAWATTAYLITSTIATPLYGKLSDIYGRKPFYLAAITIFVIGSLACTFSQSMVQLAAFRAVQGLGAGGLTSLALTIIGNIVTPRERARYQGYLLAVWAVSSVLGPMLGGFFAGQSDLLGITGWRWVFLVNVPLGAIALFVVTKVLNVPHQRQNHRIDYWGTLTFAVSIVSLLLVAEQGQEWGWSSTRAVVCYIVGGVGLVLFMIAEIRMKDEALIPFRLFRNSTFSVTVVVGTIIGVGMFGGIVLLPQYLQVVHGVTPSQAGLLSLPMMVGVVIGSVVSGNFIAKTGRYKIFPVIGTLLISGGLLLFGLLTADTPLWQPMAYMCLFGIGLGACMQTLVIAAQNVVPFQDMGVATATTTFTRQVGGTLGVTVFLSVLLSTIPNSLKDSFGDAAKDPAFQQAIKDPAVLNDPNNADYLALFKPGASQNLTDTSFLTHTNEIIAHPFKVGFSNSMDLVFLIGAIVVAFAFLISLFIKEVPLRAGGPPPKTEDKAEQPEAAAAGTATDAATDSGQATGEPVLAGVGANGNGANGNGHGNGNGNGHGDFDPFRAAPTGPGAPALPPTLAELTMPIPVIPAWQPYGPPQPGDGTGRPMGMPFGRGKQPVSGSVQHRDGSGVELAVLTLIDRGGRQVARASAAADGSYTMNAPGDGSYVLMVAAAGHRPQASSVVVNGGPATVDVTMVGAGEVTGTVRDGDGQPVSRAMLSLADPSGDVVGSGTSASDGSFRLTGIGAGPHTLVVDAPRCRPYAAQLTVPESGVIRHEVQVSQGTVLRGQARNASGRPVPDARITVLDDAGQLVTVTNTDHEGRYAIPDLGGGEYTVIASGYTPTAGQVRLKGGEQAIHNVTLTYQPWK